MRSHYRPQLRRSPFTGGSYILGGIFAVIASWLLTGCKLPKFGNSTSQDPPPAESKTGYYETAPQSLKLCATFSTAQNCNPNVNPAYVNPELAYYGIDNPIIYYAEDGTYGSLRKATNPNMGLALTHNDDGSNLEITAGGTTRAWDDDRCNFRLDLEMRDGKIRRDIPASGNLSVPISGRFEAYFTVTYTFTGVCDSSFAGIKACYQNLADCPTGSDTQANWQSKAHAYFEQWIEEGTMTADDIPNVQAVSYEVQYR